MRSPFEGQRNGSARSGTTASYFDATLQEIYKLGLQRIKVRIPFDKQRGDVGLVEESCGEFETVRLRTGVSETRPNKTKPRSPHSSSAASQARRLCKSSVGTGFPAGIWASLARRSAGRRCPGEACSAKHAALTLVLSTQQSCLGQIGPQSSRRRRSGLWLSIVRRKSVDYSVSGSGACLRRSSLGAVQISIRIVGYSFTQHQTLPFPAPTCPITCASQRTPWLASLSGERRVVSLKNHLPRPCNGSRPSAMSIVARGHDTCPSLANPGVTRHFLPLRRDGWDGQPVVQSVMEPASR